MTQSSLDPYSSFKSETRDGSSTQRPCRRGLLVLSQHWHSYSDVQMLEEAQFASTSLVRTRAPIYSRKWDRTSNEELSRASAGMLFDAAGTVDTHVYVTAVAHITRKLRVYGGHCWTGRRHRHGAALRARARSNLTCYL